MPEQLEALQRRIAGLERRLFALGISCAVATVCLFLFTAARKVRANQQPEILTVKRLAIVDERDGAGRDGSSST
jgi:hypothetical protein